MNSRTQAPAIGSTRRQATGRGRIFRGIDATRASLPRTGGSGARSAGLGAVAMIVSTAFLVLLIVPGIASAASPKHPFQGVFGLVAQPAFALPEGVAVEQSNGDVFVIDQGGNEKQKVVLTGLTSESSEFVLGNLHPTPACALSSTAAITYSSVGATRKSRIKAALGAGCGGEANFESTTAASPVVTFQGGYANQAQPLMSCVVVSGGGSCSVERQAGGHKSGVYRYNEEGEPAEFSATHSNVLDEGAAFGAKEKVQVAIDESGAAPSGNIYVAAGGSQPVKMYKSTGVEIPALAKFKEGSTATGAEVAFGEACGVAVDSSGNIYVGDHGGEVHKYVPSSIEPVAANNTANFSAPGVCSLAAGAGPSNGWIFADQGANVAKLSATTGADAYEITGTNATTVSVDPGDGHLYTAAGGFKEYDVSGASEAKVVSSTTVAGGLAAGIAVNRANGNVYYTKNATFPNIEVFAPVVGHHFQEVFGLVAQPAFALPEGVAVEQSNGDVFVIDQGGNEKQKVVLTGLTSESSEFVLGNLHPTPACALSSTAAITYSSVGATRKSRIKAALGAGCGGEANFESTTAASPVVTFQGGYANQAQPLMSCVVVSGGGSCSVERQAGGHKSGVYRYNEEGEPAEFSATHSNVLDEGAAFGAKEKVQVAIDESGAAPSGNIYVAAGGSQPVKMYKSTGVEIPALAKFKEGSTATGAEVAFGEACGVAVDSSGNIYVGDHGGEVHKYVPSSIEPVAANNTANFSAPGVCSLAAGAGPSNGWIFADQGANVAKLSATTGADAYEITGTNATTVSVDPGDGHLYTAAGGFKEYDVSGASEAKVVSSTTVAGGLAAGIAVNRANGNVYYTKNATFPNIEVFAPAAEHAVTVTVTGSGKVSQSAASVSATPPVSGSVSECTSAGGANCTATYFAGDEPELEAVAEPNSAFAEWTAVEHAASTTCAGTATPCKITLKSEPGAEDVTAQAKFELGGFPLAIEKEGSGGVTVTSVQSGLGLEAIACGVHCSELFAPTTMVELTSTPKVGSQFTGWSATAGNPGSCTGTTSPCIVTIGEAITLRAASTLESETLAVNEFGPGSVECEFAHSGSYGSCTSPQPYGTSVSVKATPSTGAELSTLSGTGSASGCSTGGCEFTITQASSVTVAFAVESETLTVNESGPGAVECEFAHSGSYGSCTSPQPYGTSVSVKATPSTGAELSTLSGTGSASLCSTGGCEFTITQASSVTAAFAVESETLTVNESGPGAVECEFAHSGSYGTCTSPQPYGTNVSVKATPDTGAELSSLSGTGSASGCSTGGCEFTITQASSVTVAFAAESETVAVNASGPGSVECEFAHSGSYGSCTSPQPYGTNVNVTPVPDTGAELTSLSGTGSASGCSLSGCEFEIKQASSVTLEFAAIANPSTLTVFKGGNGKGTVTSLAPHTGITCGPTCEEAHASFEEGETIELKAAAETGSVFAGWIGCRHITTSTCQVKLGTAEVEATAIFLIEGKEGTEGKEGPAGKEGTEGKEGATGKEGVAGKEGTAGKEGLAGKEGTAGKEGPAGKEGTAGKEGVAGKEGTAGKGGATGATGALGNPGFPGEQGEQGPAGSPGASGAQGAKGDTGSPGAQGPAGAQGKEGPAGPAGKVTCKVTQKKGKKATVTCTVKYAPSAKSSAVSRTLRWVLVGHGHVIAHGKSRGAPRIRLGALHRGRYTLYFQGQPKGTVIHVG